MSCEICCEDARLVISSKGDFIWVKGESSGPIIYSNASLKIYFSKSSTHIKFNQELKEEIRKNFSSRAGSRPYLSLHARRHHNVCKSASSSCVLSNPPFLHLFAVQSGLSFFFRFQDLKNLWTCKAYARKVIERLGLHIDDDPMLPLFFAHWAFSVAFLSSSVRSFGFHEIFIITKKRQNRHRSAEATFAGLFIFACYQPHLGDK